VSPRRAEARGPVTAPHPTELPTVNLLVRLVGPDGAADPAGAASRIEDIAAPSPGRPVAFRVVAPTYRGDLLDPDPDTLWLMTWVSERGRWELPVCRTDADGPGPRCWWLTPAGSIRRNQRRSFYRAPCMGAVAVDLLADPFATLLGRTLDLSEGGLRCLLPSAGIDPGTPVVVRLSLDGLRGVFEGVVRRTVRPARAARVAGWHREAAIAFDDPEVHGDALRRFVAREQLRQRQLAARWGR
jgi:hypothetical protein